MLISWLIMSLAFWLTAHIVPGFRLQGGFGSAIVVAAIFGLLNFFLGWFLFAVISIGTLGIGLLLSFLTHWIVNAILIKITDGMTSRLSVNGFGTALVAALLMSGLGTVGERLVTHTPLLR